MSEYCNNSKYWDRQAWATVYIQIRCCKMWHLIRVYTVCHLSSSFLTIPRGSQMDFQILGQAWEGVKVSQYMYIWRWLDEAKVSMYLASLGHQTDIGLQLGKACFYFFCFFTFIHFPLSPLPLSFNSSTISLIHFSGRWHKMTTWADLSLNPNTINQSPNICV